MIDEAEEKKWSKWLSSESHRRASKFVEHVAFCMQRVQINLKSAVYAAKEAGNQLIEAKKHIPHGLFGRWVEKEFPGSRASAVVYMRIAKNWAVIYTQCLKDNDLSLRHALKILRMNKKPKRVDERAHKPPRALVGAGRVAAPEDRWDGNAGPSDILYDAGRPEGHAMQYNQSLDHLVQTFVEAITRLDPDTVIFWSKYISPDRIREFVGGYYSEFTPIAFVVMDAHVRRDAQRADKGADPAALDEAFRMEILNALRGMEGGLTDEQKSAVYPLVKSAGVIQNDPTAFVNFVSPARRVTTDRGDDPG